MWIEFELVPIINHRQKGYCVTLLYNYANEQFNLFLLRKMLIEKNAWILTQASLNLHPIGGSASHFYHLILKRNLLLA